MDEVYDEWWAQGCPRNEGGDTVLLPDNSCDSCPYYRYALRLAQEFLEAGKNLV